jgi:hypothetical protein
MGRQGRVVEGRWCPDTTPAPGASAVLLLGLQLWCGLAQSLPDWLKQHHSSRTRGSTAASIQPCGVMAQVLLWVCR